MNNLDISVFSDLFFSLTQDWTWEIEGFLDNKDYVHPIDRDTKVISTVFERLSSPVIRYIAKKFNYVVEISNQTTYPDFTLTRDKPFHRIAIDIKTTYKRKRMVLTLGGYNSFLRNNTKNILHPYSTYNDNWILGFIYSQRSIFAEYDLDNMPRRGDIPCPYEIDSIFIRHKHDIIGLRAGSGNTKNIGSVTVNRPSDFKTINGPFTKFNHAKDAADLYWREYEKYCPQISNIKDLCAHPDFQEFEAY